MQNLGEDKMLSDGNFFFVKADVTKTEEVVILFGTSYSDRLTSRSVSFD